jgi:hypothetical protein
MLTVMIIDHDAFLDERGWLKYMIVPTRHLRQRGRRPERVDAHDNAAPDV